MEIFKETTALQIANMKTALSKLREDSEQSDCVDGLHRSLTTLQNSAGYMGLDGLKEYADRTAKLVDQGRNSGVGFELLLDILEQECAILTDMVGKELSILDAAMTPGPAGAPGTPGEEVSFSEAQEAKAPAEKETPSPQAPAHPSAPGRCVQALQGRRRRPGRTAESQDLHDHPGGPRKVGSPYESHRRAYHQPQQVHHAGKKLEAEQNSDLSAIAQDLIETTDSMGQDFR